MDKHLVWLNKKCLCSSTRKLAFYFPSFCLDEQTAYELFRRVILLPNVP